MSIEIANFPLLFVQISIPAPVRTGSRTRLSFLEKRVQRQLALEEIVAQVVDTHQSFGNPRQQRVPFSCPLMALNWLMD